LTDLQTLAINTIRTLSMDGVQNANSGHPGLPMGAAPMAYTLWMQHMNFNPHNPDWANRDRFVLSAGHGSMLLYSLLHLTGYDLSLDDIKNFRQWESKTPGHPEYGETPGVETTTGPLGQGGATAVGMALAEAYLANYFNRDGHTIVDHYTYALVSDGDLMEGVCIEASALAGHWGLGKLIYLYDDNKITLDGATDMIFTEDIAARYEAMGWHVLSVADGNDVAAISQAIADAKAVTDKPSIIAIRTIIGYGSPNKQGTSKSHGSPLGEDEVKLAKKELGWETEDTFFIPDDALNHFREAVAKGADAEAAWDTTYTAWREAYPELAAEWDQAMSGEFVDGWRDALPSWDAGQKVATRNAGGDALNALAKFAPTMIGGDADLAGSTKTLIKGANNTGHLHAAERNIRFGVREHGMGAIVNGLALHGGIIKPYSATFFTFSDYMRPAMRLGALMDIPTVYIFTHDSIGLGEDGPTHQPVEHMMALRTIPNLYVFRPADATETAGAWAAIAELDHPASIVLTRQGLPVLADNDEGIYEGVARGAYVLSEHESGDIDAIIMATGSEVSIALDAAGLLEEEDIRVRVVSMPCWELFEDQDDDYKESVLPSEITTRVSIEAGVTLGWGKYVGIDGIAMGVDTFGASAPYEKLYEEYGLTPGHVAEAVNSLLDE
jgi:transketolase